MKYKVQISFILIMICIAFSLQGEELREYKIENDTFIFRGKELKLGQKFTKESFEKKFGKADGYEFYPPGAFYLVYNKEKMTAYFTEKNVFKGFDFNFSGFKKIDLHGFIIKKGDTYMSVRQRLKANKHSFTVIEEVSPHNTEISIKMIFYYYDHPMKCIKEKILFTNDKKREVQTLIYFQETKL